MAAGVKTRDSQNIEESDNYISDAKIIGGHDFCKPCRDYRPAKKVCYLYNVASTGKLPSTLICLAGPPVAD